MKAETHMEAAVLPGKVEVLLKSHAQNFTQKPNGTHTITGFELNISTEDTTYPKLMQDIFYNFSAIVTVTQN